MSTAPAAAIAGASSPRASSAWASPARACRGHGIEPDSLAEGVDGLVEAADLEQGAAQEVVIRGLVGLPAGRPRGARRGP